MVICDVKRIKSVKDNDDKGFLYLVDTVESGYRDLKRAKLGSEMSNASMVAIIEEKLPNFIKREWSAAVNKTGSTVDDKSKFPPLLEFLLEQKRIIEYNLSDLRNTTIPGETVGAVHAMINIDSEDSSEGERSHRTFPYRCWLHKSNSHSTAECNEYERMTPEEKLNILRDKRACWSCLRIGHRFSDCRSKEPCNEDGCKMFHHRSLHECQTHGFRFHAAIQKGNSKLGFNACLLQVMSIRAKCSGKNPVVNVLWDGGATLSLITFEKASELNLEGIPIK